MPKIRDLGINVIPETMRPPEIGPGGGGGCQGASHGHPGTPGCPAGTFTITTPWWGCGNTQNCPAGTFPTTTGYWPCGNTQNCPAGTFPTTTGYWPCGNTQDCPAGTFPTGHQSHTCYAAQVQAAPPCPAGTFLKPSDVTCYEAPPGLTRESIEQLKQQLHQQIAQLDEFAKSIGPKTIQEIEAREKQIQAELEELATRRKEYERKE